MMKLSIVTNSISSVAQSAAVHIKNLCINSKVDSVFRITVSTAQTHPYITVGLGLAAIYCCRGQIEGLINKVTRVTQLLYGKMAASITSAASLFRRDSSSIQVSPSENKTASASTSFTMNNNTTQDGFEKQSVLTT